MKTYLILIGLFLVTQKAISQMIPLSLEKRIENATDIFEGKVIAQSSYWNKAHTQIYTVNEIVVYKVLKGTLSDTIVEIITLGGRVGDKMEMVTPSLQLHIGDVGMFTAIASNAKLARSSSNARLAENPNLTELRAYAGKQGFIRYNLRNHSASDPFNHYKDISKDVYSVIERQTGMELRVIKQPDYKIH